MDKERLAKKKLRAQREGNTRLFADATNDLADLYLAEGNLGAALEEHYQVVKACEILDDRLNSALTHRKIGEIYTTLSEFKKALEHQKLYLDGARGVKDKVEEQRALLALGRTYFCLAESWPDKSKGKIDALEKAKKAYSKSISLCNSFTTQDIPKQELMTMRARLLLNQGQVWVAQKEIQLGIDLLEKAIKICSVNNLIEDLHRAHLTLGHYYERQNNFRLAIEHLDFAAKAETPSTKGNALLAKAELFLRRGNWSEARRVLMILYPDKTLSQSTRHQLEKWLRTAVALTRGERKLNTSNGFKTYEDLGDAAAAAGCYNKALEYYKGMLSSAEKNKSAKETAAALFSLAQTSKDAGLYEEALKYGQRELKMCKDECEAFKSALFLANLSESIGSSGKEICKAYKLALTKAVATGNPWLEITALKEYVDYLENNGSRDAARMKKRLKMLQETTPEIQSQRESTENPHIGADVDLDDLSDIEQTETTKKPKSKRRTGSVVKRNLKGETQLHIACIRGKIERVKELLDNGHPTNERDYCGWTPLHEAANHGFTEKVTLLLEAGAEINDPGGPKCGGVTPLHDAATNGHLAVMNLLINKGADIYAMTEEGETTLDSLEDWRKRVDKLSPADEKRYLHVRNKLWARKVRRREETKRIERAVTEINANCSQAKDLVNMPNGEGYKKIMRLVRNRNAPLNSFK